MCLTQSTHPKKMGLTDWLKNMAMLHSLKPSKKDDPRYCSYFMLCFVNFFFVYYPKI